MLRDKAVIGYMGLPDREIAVIQCIFSLTEAFHSTFQLPRADERRSADVVFVNADNTEHISAYERYASQKSGAIPIYVTTDGRDFDNSFSLKRPLVLKKIIDILDRVRHHYTESSTKPSATDISECFKILVVDDSLPVRTYMQQKLMSLSPVALNVEFAESGDEAITRLKSDEYYDLVFMDVMMPGTDGYKTCKWIKAHMSTYVVMLTSRGSSFDKIRGAMSGCDTYLVKPPQDNELKEILNSRIEQFNKARASGDRKIIVSV